MRIAQIATAGFLGILLMGCGSGNKTYVKKGEIDRTIDQQAVNKRYLEAIGIGAADSTLTNSTQRRATSRSFSTRRAPR